jgi:hypothetical protein
MKPSAHLTAAAASGLAGGLGCGRGPVVFGGVARIRISKPSGPSIGFARH